MMTQRGRRRPDHTHINIRAAEPYRCRCSITEPSRAHFRSAEVAGRDRLTDSVINEILSVVGSTAAVDGLEGKSTVTATDGLEKTTPYGGKSPMTSPGAGKIRDSLTCCWQHRLGPERESVTAGRLLRPRCLVTVDARNRESEHERVIIIIIKSLV